MFKKFKFKDIKVGDIVRVRKSLKEDNTYGGAYFNGSMAKRRGSKFVVTSKSYSYYDSVKLETLDGHHQLDWHWTPEMLKKEVAKEIDYHIVFTAVSALRNEVKLKYNVESERVKTFDRPIFIQISDTTDDVANGIGLTLEQAKGFRKTLDKLIKQINRSDV